MKLTTVMLFSLSTFSATAVYANDAEKLNTAFNQLCDKMEVCAMEQMGKEEDLTPQMRNMIKGMIEGVCKDLMDVGEVYQYAELVDPAVACIDSMSSQSCEALQGDNLQTPACKEYEALAKDYEGDNKD